MSTGPGGEDVYTCLTCSVAFYTAPEQRDHFRSDLHRYNMKRRVANLAPVSAQVFNEKIMERRTAMESSAQATKEDTGRCHVCSKNFSSQNAYRDHMQSRKHREMMQKQANKPKVAARTMATETPSSLANVQDLRDALPEDEGSDEDEDDELDEETKLERAVQKKLAKARRIDPATECMFCSEKQPSLDVSLSHMQSAHGFFVPERKYLVDLPGLLGYLADKVSVGNVCLWCNGKGRGFHNLGAVQKHMMDKSHCKVAYETQEEQLEFSDFYDFRSSYPDYKKKDNDEWEDASDDEEDGEVVWEDASSDDEEDNDDEVPVDDGIRYGDSEYELVLPSGARLGHRSLQRYYRQSLWQTPAGRARETASVTNGRALAHRIAGEPSKDLVVTSRGGNELVARNRGEAKEATRHIREFRDVQRREQFKTKVGYRHNNQKHFRDPLLQ